MSTTVAPKDAKEPLFSASTMIKIEMAGWVVMAFLAWHLALVVTAGQRFTDLLDTWNALRGVLAGDSPTAVAGHGPVEGNAPAIVALVFFALFLCLRFGVSLYSIRRKKKAKKAAEFGNGLSTHKELTARIDGEGGAQLAVAPLMLGGKPVSIRREDTAAALSVPRGGKSSRMVIPKIHQSRGAVVTTSTRPDVMRATILQRSKVGTVYVADFDGLTNWPDKLKWDLVAGCEDDKMALSRAAAMVNAMPTGGDSSSGAHFEDGCRKIIRALLHAAALKDGGNMRDVMHWAQHFEDKTPAKLIESRSKVVPMWAADLDQWCRKDNPKTIGNTRTTLFRVLDPLMSESVLSQLCPAVDETQMNIREFCESSDTLYALVDDDSGMGTAPIVTALVESIAAEYRLMANRSATGKLETEMSFLLDEVTNVCPIPSLPKLMTAGGGSGLHTWIWAQGYGQLVERYGDAGAETIFFTGAAAKIIFGSSGEMEFLRRVSELVGSHWVDHRSTSTTTDKEGDPQISTTVSSQLDFKMRPDEIRKLPDDKVLLLYRNLEAVVDLTPWWKRHDAAAFQASLDWCAKKEGTTSTDMSLLEDGEAETAA